MFFALCLRVLGYFRTLLLYRIYIQGWSHVALWGGLWPLPKKKVHRIYTNFNCPPPPNDVHSAPPSISVQYFNSLPDSSFKCRLFYPLIKQNMAHSPLIFKYPKHYPTKQHFITHSPTQNQKIQNPFFYFSFYSLLVYCVHATAHSTGSSSPQTKQNIQLSLAFLSNSVLTIPKKKKKKLTIIFFLLTFLK